MKIIVDMTEIRERGVSYALVHGVVGACAQARYAPKANKVRLLIHVAHDIDVRELAEKLYSARTVAKALAQLEEDGKIERRATKDANGDEVVKWVLN